MRNISSLAPPLLLLLLLLLPAVRPAWQPLRNPSFTHIRPEAGRSWDQARTYCRQEHVDLATISDAQDNHQLWWNFGWIGLQRGSDGNWRWSRDDTVASYYSWADGYPKDQYDCAYKRYNLSEWKSFPCYFEGSFICSDDRVFLVKEEKTWEEALAYCRALAPVNPSKPAQDFDNHRYDLVTLKSDDDFDFAREKAEGATTAEVWTGLRLLAGHWLWVDGEEVQGGQQLPGEPTQGCLSSCGAMATQGGDSVQARDCSLRKNFLCFDRYTLWTRKIP